MELENQTGLPAALMRGIISEDGLFGSLVVRVTWDIAGDGQLRLATEQPWTVSPGPWDGPAGKMPGDELFYRGGVDVFVLGSACAPGGQWVPYVEVVVEVGKAFRYSLYAIGDRVWQAHGSGLQPSTPRPFTRMPLTLANAYGGADLWDELPIPYQDNPEGKGYYLSQESATGKPLPNIEDPLHPVRAWSDQPEPVGVAVPPSPFGPRLRRSVEFDSESGMLTKLDPTFYNHAFPALVAPPGIAAGDFVRVSGVRPAGPLAFLIPPTPVRARVRVGDREVVQVPPVDQIGIEPDLARAFITYRYPFRYRLVPLEERSCELFPADGRAA